MWNVPCLHFLPEIKIQEEAWHSSGRESCALSKWRNRTCFLVPRAYIRLVSFDTAQDSSSSFNNPFSLVEIPPYSIELSFIQRMSTTNHSLPFGRHGRDEERHLVRRERRFQPYTKPSSLVCPFNLSATSNAF